MGIAAHVIEHLLGPCERSFGIDNPIALFQVCQKLGERRPLMGNSSGPVEVASQKSLRILGLDLDIA